MGDPRKRRKKYQTPSHPWEGSRIEEENKLVKDFGFKNKTEIWKMKSILANFIGQTRNLISDTTKQGEIEKKQLLDKLNSLGLLTKTSKLEDILGLTHMDMLERRLQTLVFRKGIAKSPKQARQFIVHGHIMIENKKITSPSYLVLVDEEPKIRLAENSPIELFEEDDTSKKPGETKPVAKKKETKSEEKPKTEKKEEAKTEDKKEVPKEESKKKEEKKPKGDKEQK